MYLKKKKAIVEKMDAARKRAKLDRKVIPKHLSDPRGPKHVCNPVPSDMVLFTIEATLVAVSKTKPSSMIKTLYDCGQTHFGENYVTSSLANAYCNSQSLLSCRKFSFASLAG